MEYNSQRENMVVPEYGRNIQKMIELTAQMENREERTKAAYAIVGIMAQINPSIKESSDYLHTLWDHMYIMSKFKLEVDGAYPPPSQEILNRKPDRIPYSVNRIRFRHYGKNIENIIKLANDFEEGPEKEALIQALGNQLKKSYLNWNRESVADETIAAHLNELSGGKLKLMDDHKLTSTVDILARNKPKKKKFTPGRKDNIGRRKNYGSKSY
jgi:hypothetical protein